ncbi:MAG: hypothetical protein U0414_22620 [Polyangiaceae bacterium]
MLKLEPLGLANALDTWALRREKVLSKLDIQAAREARELAAACRDFHDWPRRSAVTELELTCVWLELRERCVRLLSRYASPLRVSTPSGTWPAAPPPSAAGGPPPIKAAS